MAQLIDLSLIPALDGDGDAFSGAELRLFLSGTSTQALGYTSAALSTAHPVPLLADAAGRFPAVYVSGAVALRATVTQGGSVVRDIDPIYAPLTADDVIYDGTETVGDVLDGLAGQWDFTPDPSGGDDTAALQAVLDGAFAAERNVAVLSGDYEVTTLDLPGSAAERGKAIHIEGQGCGEAFAGIQGGSIIRGTETDAPTFRYVPDTVNTGNGMAIVEKIRFEGDTTTPVVDFDTFYSQSQFRHNAIFQSGTGDGLRIGMSNTIQVHDTYVLNGDWNTSGEIARTGVGVLVTNSLDGGAGLTTLSKITSRGFEWAYVFGDTADPGGALYSFSLRDSECSVVTNGIHLTADCQSFVVDSCYIEGGSGGVAIKDDGKYSDVTNNLIFSGFGTGIDASDVANSSTGNNYSGNIISLGRRANSTAIKAASTGAFGGNRKTFVGNTIVFSGGFGTNTWTGSISGTTMTVTAILTGQINDGMEISGSGVTGGTLVVDQLTGTSGGVGTYEVSISQTVGSTTITGLIPGVVGIDISGIDPALDFVGTASDPRGPWPGGTGTQKVKDTSTSSDGTTGSGVIGLGFAASRDGNWWVPALRRGAINLKVDPTALTEANVAAGVLTLGELSVFTMTAGGAVNVSEFAAANLPDKTFQLHLTNANTTLVQGTKIKLSGSANFTPGAGGSWHTFQIKPGGVAWETARIAY